MSTKQNGPSLPIHCPYKRFQTLGFQAPLPTITYILNFSVSPLYSFKWNSPYLDLSIIWDHHTIWGRTVIIGSIWPTGKNYHFVTHLHQGPLKLCLGVGVLKYPIYLGCGWCPWCRTIFHFRLFYVICRIWVSQMLKGWDKKWNCPSFASFLMNEILCVKKVILWCSWHFRALLMSSIVTVQWGTVGVHIIL